MNIAGKIRHATSPMLIVSKIVATYDGSEWGAHLYYNDDKYETFDCGRTLREAIANSLRIGPAS